MSAAMPDCLRGAGWKLEGVSTLEISLHVG